MVVSSCSKKEEKLPLIGSWNAIERETIKYSNTSKQVIETHKITPANGLNTSISFSSLTKSDKGDFEIVGDSLVFKSTWPNSHFRIDGSILILKYTRDKGQPVESRVTETYIRQ